MIIKIGNTAANLSGTSSKIRSGKRGENRLESILERWGNNKNGPIILATSIQSDGKGDIDFILATSNIIVCVDAKNWGTGYYGLTPEFKIRRNQSTTRPPKGRSRGIETKTENQMRRLQDALTSEGIEGFRILKPIICLTSTNPKNVRIFKDKNWVNAPFILTSSNEIETLLNKMVQPIQSTPQLKQLAQFLNRHKIGKQ